MILPSAASVLLLVFLTSQIATTTASSVRRDSQEPHQQTLKIGVKEHQSLPTTNFHRRLQGASWAQRGADINGDVAGDQSGWSVSSSVDGKVVAIGATRSEQTGVRSDYVRVFEWDGAVWTQRGLDIMQETGGDRFGATVSLSANGSILAIGAPGNDGNGGSSGNVRVLEWDGLGGVWTQRGGDINGERALDQSGFSVSLSANGNILASGAIGNDGGGNRSGHVRVMKWDGVSAWNQLGGDIDGETLSNEYGASVSLSGDGRTVAVGAPFNDGSGGTDSGHVRVLKWDSVSAWNQLGADIDGENAGDLSGNSVSLSDDGSIVAIGAQFNDGNGIDSGHVRVMEWDGVGGVWTQRGGDINGEAAGDQSGFPVSISGDGNILAIGARYNAGSGHVLVMRWDGTLWNQVGLDIQGESAGAQNGRAVSLSGDGRCLAIGAPFHDLDGIGLDSGYVRVYTLSCPAGSELKEGNCATPECYCNGGGELQCGSCGVSGDPHFKTWTGKKYDFHGECDLVLLQNPDFHLGLGMHVHIRTKIQGRYSSVETAAVRIGEDTMQVQSAGDKTLYWINGVASVELPATLSGFPIEYTEVGKGKKKKRIFTISLDGDEQIVINTFKKLVQVLFKNAKEDSFAGSVGLMGAFETGKKLARNGETVIKRANKFGNEWQVRSSEPALFNVVEGPQHPDKCGMPLTTASKATKRRRLSESVVGEKEAANVCAHVALDERDDCIFDVLATGDIEMVAIYETTETVGVH